MGSVKFERRKRVKMRIRKKVSGTAERPRLAVFRSNKQIYCQLIDDTASHTLAAASSKELSSTGNKVDASKEVGALVAKKAIAAGISKCVFDRGGYLYHGRVKSLAEGAREGGLQF